MAAPSLLPKYLWIKNFYEYMDSGEYSWFVLFCSCGNHKSYLCLGLVSPVLFFSSLPICHHLTTSTAELKLSTPNRCLGLKMLDYVVSYYGKWFVTFIWPCMQFNFLKERKYKMISFKSFMITLKRVLYFLWNSCRRRKTPQCLWNKIQTVCLINSFYKHENR